MASVACNRSGPPNPRRSFRIYVVTWNMNGKAAYDDLVGLVADQKHQRCDFYVIGLQEAPPKAKNFANTLQTVLGQGYCLMGTSTLQSLQLFIFTRRPLQKRITALKIDKIKGGGLGGIVGRQKGAVGIAFKFLETSFCFISCHLPPHESKVERRNYHYQMISQSIFSKRRRRSKYCRHLMQYPWKLLGLFRAQKNNDKDKIVESTDSFSMDSCDVVLWIGDLNYRIERSRRSVNILIDQNRQNSLRASDQLSREAERGEIFNGFREGPLSFRPTYKYDIGSDIYDSSPKERVPSWTDRILYKINPLSYVAADLEDYDRIDSIKVSDHRPVKAVLRITVGTCSIQRR